jgi:hypothetical protein
MQRDSRHPNHARRRSALARNRPGPEDIPVRGNRTVVFELAHDIQRIVDALKLPRSVPGPALLRHTPRVGSQRPP